MTKIKNYRIPWREHEVQRFFKKRTQKELDPGSLSVLSEILADAKKQIEPSAVFETYPIQQLTDSFPRLPLPEKAVGCSVLAVHMNEKSNEWVSRWKPCVSKEVAEPLFETIYAEALRQSTLFIVKLLQDQAKEEDSVVSTYFPFLEKHFGAIHQLLQTERIGISPADATLSPYSQLAWVFWLSSSRNSSKQVQQATESIRESFQIAA